MSVEQYGIRQGFMFVAKVDIGEDRERAQREAMHYLAMYGQDGPVELWYRSRQRKWRQLEAISFPQADQSPEGQDRADGLDAQHASGGAEGMRQKGGAA